jgi:hypothetical protein
MINGISAINATGAMSFSMSYGSLVCIEGAIVSDAPEPKYSVWPSAGALSNACVATMPPEPGLLSITTGWPHTPVSSVASSRARTSPVLPAVTDTMNLTGLEGNASAQCAATANIVENASAQRRRVWDQEDMTCFRAEGQEGEHRSGAPRFRRKNNSQAAGKSFSRSGMPYMFLLTPQSVKLFSMFFQKIFQKVAPSNYPLLRHGAFAQESRTTNSIAISERRGGASLSPSSRSSINRAAA